MKNVARFLAIACLASGFVGVVNAYTVIKEGTSDGKAWKKIRCASGTEVTIQQSADGSGKWINPYDLIAPIKYADWRDLVKYNSCQGRGE
ncbi:MAG: hypothetical protein ACOYMG_20470 [Candidatus Methylumidiphilus sp.]